jgi:elongation factor G
MKGVAVSETRSFAFVGHTGSGKTSIVEAILHKLGVNERLGSVDAGSSMSDYTDGEKARKISIYSTSFSGAFKASNGKEHDIVFEDTPGYMDFYGQVLCTMRTVATAVVTVDAASGVQVGTQRVWKCAQKEGVAKAVIITGLDKDNTDFSKTVSEIQAVFGANCVPVTIPLPDNSGVVDIISGKGVPDDMKDEVEAARSALFELAAETDDELIEKFLGGEALTAEEVSKGLKKAVKSGGLIPIFTCLSMSEVGIDEFLDGACRMFPCPTDVEVRDIEDNIIPNGADDPFVGFVWRSVNDPFVGQLVFTKVLAGSIKVNDEVMNATKGQKEKIGSMLVMNGKKQYAVEEASLGDIVAIPKLKFTSFGDTLCCASAKTVCKPINFPSPVTLVAVFAKTQADEDKIGTALQRVVEDDPTIKVTRNKETGEELLCGLGDVHIDVAVARMKSRSNVDVTLETPKVPYRETVTGSGEGRYKHKKQSGGRGQYGEVYLRVASKPADDEEFFHNAIVGGVIPGNFIPAVKKGVVAGMLKGAVAGYPVTNVKSTVYDGSYHDVDSSEIAFKIAAGKAFKEAMAEAKPVLLEPIMTVKVTIPSQHMGDINGDLNHRRGRILGMETDEGLQILTAEVPQSELFRYAAELRSMTSGQGSFEMDFCRYDVVPSSVAQKVVAAAAKDKEEGE